MTVGVWRDANTLIPPAPPCNAAGMSLARFKTAQDAANSGFATALAELQAGQKQSHWIWYVFPQLAGLGQSPTARLYGLAGLDEARAYRRDAELAGRLSAAVEAVAQHLARGLRLIDLMGGRTDALKLVSSLTLFERVAQDEGDADFAWRCAEILAVAERQGFPRCAFT